MEKDWQRYKCQIALPGFGEEAQQRLKKARVLIAGAGGLGCPAAQYLTAAGVGHIAIVDHDIISESNLHRQILYSPNDVGKFKADVACEILQRQNPGIEIISILNKINSTNIVGLISSYDIIADCTDNFETRYLINDSCVILEKPVVYGAIYRFEGQVAVWNIKNSDGTRSPNYRDIFPEVNSDAIPDCADGGVLPTVAGITGCIQANEVIKFITGSGDLLAAKMFLIDTLTTESRIINLRKSSNIIVNNFEDTISLITPEDLFSGMQKNQTELYDVRNSEERNFFNIGGKHITPGIISSLNNFDRNKMQVFYCQTGRRSVESARIFKKYFPEAKVFSLNGGLTAWQKQIIQGCAETQTSPSS